MEGSYILTIDGLSGGAEAAWRGLAAFAGCLDRRPTGPELAERIERDPLVRQSHLAIRNFLHEILVDAEADPDAGRVLEDVSALIENLTPEILPGILGVESEEHRRTAFLTAAARRLSLGAVLRCASAIAAAYERPFPEWVRQCVRKLAQRSGQLPGDQGREVELTLRDHLGRQFLQWTKPVRTGVTQGFEPVIEKVERRPQGRTVPEASRLLEMAIECDTIGPSVWMALQEVVQEGGIASVIDVMKRAPDNSGTAASIMKRIGTPQELRTLLRAEPFDGAAVDTVLRGMGIAAANVLLDELVESQARLTRRYLMERLARYGEEIRPLVEGRFKDSRWFVQRNMLALLRAAKCHADMQLASKFLTHKDARVRREAVLWCLDWPATRDEAMLAALSDRDVSVLRPAMQSARGNLPAACVPVLARRVLDSDFPPEFRVLALKLLGRSGSILAVEALLHYAQNGRTLLGKPKLAPKSPEMLAAVAALARGWPTERRAAVLLEQARRSRDPEIAAAASPPEADAAAA